MKRYLLKVGDQSTSGGTVVEGIDCRRHHGTPLTFVGAKVACTACRSTGVIVAQGPRHDDSFMGKQSALEGDLCVCKCTPTPTMVASQRDSSHTFTAQELVRKGFDASGRSLRKDAPSGDYDEQVRVIDANGKPMCSAPYHIRTATGTVYKGLTNSQGYCPRVYTKNVASLDIAVGMKALERWDQ